MDIAEDVLQAAREAMCEPGTGVLRGSVIECAARAILAEREASEARMLELLKDPVAVRVNWMRGGINADSIIAEERERCAKIADPPLMHRKGAPGLWRRRRAEIASSIRSGASTE